jgi:hypothetical protein
MMSITYAQLNNGPGFLSFDGFLSLAKSTAGVGFGICGIGGAEVLSGFAAP